MKHWPRGPVLIEAVVDPHEPPCAQRDHGLGKQIRRVSRSRRAKPQKDRAYGIRRQSTGNGLENTQAASSAFNLRAGLRIL
jgi:hypothetical protein